MIFRIFLVILMGIILPIMYFVLKHYGNADGERIFGVTIGSEHINEEEIKAIQKVYIKEMNRYALICLAVLIGMIFIRYESIFYTVLMFWIFLIVILLELPFMKASSAVMLKKIERGWNGEYPRGSTLQVEAVMRRKQYRRKGILGAVLSTLILDILILIEYFRSWNDMFLLIVASVCHITFLACWLFYILYEAYKIPKDKTKEKNRMDEDENWVYGMFYYNKEDPTFLVEKRIGIGTTINMARPAAKVGAILLGLVLLTIPASSIWLIADEFTPVGLTITSEAVVSRQFEGTYRLSFDRIKEVKVLTEFPDSDKLVGTGLENLYRGSFRVDGYDKCKVCVDPRNHYFLVFTMVDGKVYILSDDTDEGTKAIYDKLLLQWKDV